MDYEDFRRYLCEFYRIEYSVNNDKGLFSFRIPFPTDESMIVEEGDLKEKYENINTYNFKEAIMFNEKYMEIILNEDSEVSLLSDFRQDDCWNLEDNQNGLKYEISEISKDFLLYLLKKSIKKIYISQEETRMDSKLFLLWRQRNFSRMRGKDLKDFEGNTLIEYLIKGLRGRIVTLKIQSAESKDSKFFMNLKNAYLFNTMYFTNRGLTEFLSIDSVIFPTRVKIDRTKQQLENAPFKVYNPDIINYYKKAMSSGDPYIQYISFYHILEYFFDETYHRYLISDLRDKLTHPDFSYKNDEELLKLAHFSKNRLRQFGEDGQGNELESLKYVLKEFIDIQDLADRLESEEKDYYSNSKVSFSSGPIINFKDSTGFSPIAKRLYFTRNSLVHSKSGKKELSYHPYIHENILKKETPLIKKIAELIIINSANLL